MNDGRTGIVDDENWAEISSRIVNETGTIESLMEGKDSFVPHGKKEENVDGDSQKDSPSEIVPPVVQEPVASVREVTSDTASSLSKKEGYNVANVMKQSAGRRKKAASKRSKTDSRAEEPVSSSSLCEKKCQVYFSSDMYSDLMSLCHLRRVSVSTYIRSLVEVDLMKNSKVIEDFNRYCDCLV